MHPFWLDMVNSSLCVCVYVYLYFGIYGILYKSIYNGESHYDDEYSWLTCTIYSYRSNVAAYHKNCANNCL